MFLSKIASQLWFIQFFRMDVLPWGKEISIRSVPFYPALSIHILYPEYRLFSSDVEKWTYTVCPYRLSGERLPLVITVNLYPALYTYSVSCWLAMLGNCTVCPYWLSAEMLPLVIIFPSVHRCVNEFLITKVAILVHFTPFWCNFSSFLRIFIPAAI